MKRKNFLITSTVGHNVTKHAWNSAVQEVEKLVLSLAHSVGQTYVLTKSESIKEGFYHVAGTREWTNAANNATVVFTIKQQD